MEIYFQWYQHEAPFDSEEKRKELLERLNQIGGVNIPPTAITKRPNIKLSQISNPMALEQFTSVFDWVIGEILAV